MSPRVVPRLRKPTLPADTAQAPPETFPPTPLPPEHYFFRVLRVFNFEGHTFREHDRLNADDPIVQELAAMYPDFLRLEQAK